MANNIPSFRYPFTMPKDVHPQVANALRSAYNSLSDLNQAIEALNTKVATLQPTTSSTSLALAVSGIPNSDQLRLNLQSADSSVVLTDLGKGNVDLAAATSSGFPVANVGDTVRYNEYTDGNWDAVNAVPENFVRIYCDPVNTGVQTIGTSLSVQLGGTSTRTVSTATEPPMQNLLGSAVASLNALNFVFWGVSSSTSYICLGIIRRLSMRLRMNTIANVRYWIGLFPNSTSNVANNFTTDVPNVGYLAFRFSAGTDTTIKAVCGTSSVAQTVVDTTIPIDTVNSQMFDIAVVAGVAYFYIKGALVATISTTIPVSGSLMSMGVLADNKNTNNANSFDFAYGNLSYK